MRNIFHRLYENFDSLRAVKPAHRQYVLILVTDEVIPQGGMINWRDYGIRGKIIFSSPDVLGNTIISLDIILREGISIEKMNDSPKKGPGEFKKGFINISCSDFKVNKERKTSSTEPCVGFSSEIRPEIFLITPSFKEAGISSGS